MGKRQGLVARQIINKKGVLTTVYVQPNTKRKSSQEKKRSKKLEGAKGITGLTWKQLKNLCSNYKKKLEITDTESENFPTIINLTDRLYKRAKSEGMTNKAKRDLWKSGRRMTDKEKKKEVYLKLLNRMRFKK